MNNMDFLKSCTTNLCGLENVLDISYCVYKLQHDDSDPARLYALIALIRERKILCSLVADKIWVFGAVDSELTQLIHEQRIIEKCQDTKSIADALPADAAAARDVLLDAIEGSLASLLATQDGLTHLGSWQWIYIPTESYEVEEASIVFRMHVKLAETGVLMLSVKSYTCDLSPVLDVSANMQVILAPSGRFGLLDSQPLVSSSRQLQAHEPNGSETTWRTLVTTMLSSEGVYVDPDQHWLAIEHLDEKRKGRFWWPLRLCFTHRLYNRTRTNFIASLNWNQWFRASTSHGHREAFKSPLAFAEEWFSSRSQLIPAVDSAAENTVDTADSIIMSPFATSPPFSQRGADLQVAMFGIYPTPPDGMLPGPVPSLQTTTSDGLNDSLQAMDNSQTSEGVDMQRLQAERTMSSEGVVGYQAHNDDLFGDIAEIEFGANEVADEDFDYFDEPDEATNLIDSGEENIDMTSDIFLPQSDPQTQQHEAHTASPMHDLPGTSSPVQSNELSLDATETAVMHHELASSTSPPYTTQTRRLNPLSPFNIRERLLPPPVPASADQPPSRAVKRSRNNFAPMDFNEGMDFGGKPLYVQYNGTESSVASGSRDPLHRTARAAEVPLVSFGAYTQDSMDVDSSDEDSGRSVVGAGDLALEALPPALPWESIKRKRDDTLLTSGTSAPTHLFERVIGLDQTGPHDLTLQACSYMLPDKLSPPIDIGSLDAGLSPAIPPSDIVPTRSAYTLAPIGTFFNLYKIDLVAIAQIITEQAVSTVHLRDNLQTHYYHQHTSTLKILIVNCIRQVLPGAEDYSIEKLLPLRENAAGNPSISRTTTPLHNPPAASVGMQGLPAVFPIPAPHVRVQRSSDNWEVLPSALPFWPALGLGPASEPKNIDVLFVLPDGDELSYTVEGFAEDLRQVYEGYKLGSFSRGVQDLMVPVNITEGESLELTDAIKAYAAKCSELGESLTESKRQRSDQTTVICLVNPFEADPFAKHHLCACFWLLYKAYLGTAKIANGTHSRGDIVLQIIPISLIASPCKMALPDSQHLNALAMEIYDRCPLSAKMMASTVESSALPIFAAPAVELANLTHRRIGFQPTMEPPSDLLQEGSILHLAYAFSNDGQWTTVCWIGSGGRSQRTMSFSLRGTSFAEVAACIWEQTLEIIAVREVMWRVFLAATADIDEAVKECWRRVVTAKPRKQMLHVTLVSLDADSPAQFTPEQQAETTKSATTPGGGFLTPGSTPQAATFTVSPDASGPTNAPLTPAPSDGITGAGENDADAYLMDSADDAWGMLLSPSVALTSLPGVVHGLLLRRGSSNEEPLETLGVGLHWDIRLRPSGHVDDGHSRQIESNLREVLKLYRHLCALTKIRGLHGGEKESAVLLPVHALCAVQGARALNGLMR